MAVLFDILVLAAIGFFAWRGFLYGVIATAWVAVQTLLSFSLGLLLLEVLSSPVSDGLRFLLEPMLPQGFAFEAWSVFLTFTAASGAGLAALRWLVPGPHLAIDEELSLAEKVGGGVAGAAGGAVLAGGILVALSMQPLTAAVRPPANRMYCDAGEMVILATARFTGDSHNGWWVVAYGEPPADRSDPQAKVTSEPWFDPDFNSRFDEGESFSDFNQDGVFTQDIYYQDLDGSNARRPGLADKYRAGRWDFSLKADSRRLGSAAAPQEDRQPASPPQTSPPEPERPPTAAAAENTQSSPPDRPKAVNSDPPPGEPKPQRNPLDDF